MPEIYRNPSGGMPEIGEGYEWNRDGTRAIQGVYMGEILCMSSITPLYVLYRSSSAFTIYQLQEYVQY
jgi:hypothetical protein